MHRMLWTAAFLGLSFCSGAQTAEELVAKNIQAKGGLEKIKAIKTLRMNGRYQVGDFTAEVGQDSKVPNFIRQTFTVQGMSRIQAYDGSTGWQISPFEGRKDPELLGEEDLRSLTEDADFYGPLVDYKEKGNTVEYLGMGTVDGDDAYRLKVTLKNGDVFYYYLDPETYLEIRIEKRQFIRGSLHEVLENMGSYKLVNGVYFPFDWEEGDKRNPNSKSEITFESIQANVPLEDAVFRMPAAPATSPPAKLAEPPPATPTQPKSKPKRPAKPPSPPSP